MLLQCKGTTGEQVVYVNEAGLIVQAPVISTTNKNSVEMVLPAYLLLLFRRRTYLHPLAGCQAVGWIEDDSIVRIQSLGDLQLGAQVPTYLDFLQLNRVVLVHDANGCPFRSE